jgi:hypothetical protein
MFRKATLVTAVVSVLAVLGATSASGMDDNRERMSSPSSPLWVEGGVYGYSATSGWIVYDVYLLPNGSNQRICHPVENPTATTAC